MKRLSKQNAAVRRSGLGAFALCSAFLLVGAFAGAFAGSFAETAGAALIGSGAGFWEYLAKNLAVVALIALFASSCVGFLFIPPLVGAVGFFAGFAMAAVSTAGGGWTGAFLRCGWIIALALPFFMALCSAAMRAAVSAFALINFQIRSAEPVRADFLRILLASAAAAAVLAALQTAVL